MILSIRRRPRSSAWAVVLVAALLLLRASSAPAGYVILCDDNTYASQGQPPELTAKLDEIRAKGSKLKWVTFHPNGGWIVLYDKGGHAASNLPKVCADKLDELAARGAELKSVVFTPWWDGRGWVILHDRNGHTADQFPPAYLETLDEAARKGAEIRSYAVARTGGAVVLLGTNSYQCDGADVVKKTLAEIASRGAEIRSVTFTDWGAFAIAADHDGYGSDELGRDVNDELKKLAAAGRSPICIAFCADPIRLSHDDDATRARVVELMARYKVPGLSIAVIDQGAITWAHAYGVVTPGGKPVTPDTLFQAASISKSVTTVGLLRLVERGKLSLDDDFNQYLTSWKIPANPYTKDHPVTLRRILSHTAGFTVHGFPGYRADVTPPTLVQLLNGQPPANTKPVVVEAQPGGKFSYSGGGYCVAQQAAIDVTGKPFAQLMGELVLAPLGMTRSSYEQPLRTDWRDAAAIGHKEGKAIPGNWRTYPEMSPAGLWATPSDIARFVLALQHAARGDADAILRPDTIRQMLTRQAETSTPGDGYGLGVTLHGTGAAAQFGHEGRNGGFDCQMIGYVTGGRGAVIMINANETGGLIDELMRDIRAEYGWPD